MGDGYSDYWTLREALYCIQDILTEDDSDNARMIRAKIIEALRDTDLANRREPVPLTDAEIDALIKSDQGDSYYVTLPDGTSTPIGYTAEAYVERSELRAAARRVLERESS